MNNPKLIDLNNGIFLDLNNGETKEDFNLFHERKSDRRKIDYSFTTFDLFSRKEKFYIDIESNEIKSDRRRNDRRKRYIPEIEDIRNDLKKYGYSSF